MKIKKIIEDNGFKVEKVNGGYELSQYTPAGEDWMLTFDKLEDIVDYAENYDPAEDFVMWYEARKNGTRGVPDNSTLWEDQMWKKELLMVIADKVMLNEEKNRIRKNKKD